MSSERLRRAARSAIRGVEAIWRAGFALAGNERVARWSSPGGLRVLCVAPHPDDETAGCGGTLARHAAAGDDVRVVVVTDGRLSRAHGFGPAEMARTRRGEAEGAASALGASLSLLDLPEGSWSAADAERALSAELAAFRPDLVYAPSRFDFHGEHVKVAHALARALGPLGPPARVRIYAVQVPLGPLTNLVSDVTGVEALPRALAAHATQAGALLRTLRIRRYAAAFHRAGELAEELRELSPAAYAALHAGPPDAEPWRRFRSLRQRPFTDPLAWLVGRAARREAARSAE
jgi:LmbE family N-acetylglucosaminyl deacetylase